MSLQKTRSNILVETAKPKMNKLLIPVILSTCIALLSVVISLRWRTDSRFKTQKIQLLENKLEESIKSENEAWRNVSVLRSTLGIEVFEF